MRGGGLLLRQTAAADGDMSHAGPEANRREALRAMGLGIKDMVCCEQVHGGRVHWVGARDRGRGMPLPGADGVITREPGLALMVLGADCPLICLYDPAQPAVAALHAGWRGIVAGVLREGLSLLGSPAPGGVRGFLGPCAGPCCYEVGREVADRFRDEAVLRSGGRLYLNLPRAVELELGIVLERVGPTCTICGDGVYSHRRTGTAERHALIAMLAPPRKP